MSPLNSPTQEPSISIESHLSERTKMWEQNGYYLIYFCVAATMIGVISAFLYEKTCYPGAGK